MGTDGLFRKLAARPGTYAFLSATVISAGWYFSLIPKAAVGALGVIFILLGVLDLDVWEVAIGIRAPLNLRVPLTTSLGVFALAIARGWSDWWVLSGVLATGILALGTPHLIARSGQPNRLASLARRWRSAWMERGAEKRWVIGWGLAELSSQEFLEAVLALLIILPVVVAIFLGLALELTLLSGPVGIFLLGGAGVAGLANVESRSEMKASVPGPGAEEGSLRGGVLEVFLENAHRLPVFILSLWAGVLGMAMVVGAGRKASSLVAGSGGLGSAVEDGFVTLALLGIALVIGLTIYHVLRHGGRRGWRPSAYLGLGLQSAVVFLVLRSKVILQELPGLNARGTGFATIGLDGGRVVLEASILPARLGGLRGWDAGSLLSLLVMVMGLGLFLQGKEGGENRYVADIPLPLLSLASFSILVGWIIQPHYAVFIVPVFAVGVYPLSRVVSSILAGRKLGEERKEDLIGAMLFCVFLVGSLQTIIWFTQEEILKAVSLLCVIGFVILIKEYPPAVRWPAWILLGVKPLDGPGAGERDDG